MQQRADEHSAVQIPRAGEAAADMQFFDNETIRAAEFVSLAIQGTPYTQDTRFGVWFEPLLPRLCPVSWND